MVRGDGSRNKRGEPEAHLGPGASPQGGSRAASGERGAPQRTRSHPRRARLPSRRLPPVLRGELFLPSEGLTPPPSPPAIAPRPRSPLTSLQTSPLRQGLPLPPPASPQSPWKPAPSSCRLRPRSPAASPGKAVASSNGCATCPRAAIFYPARGSGVAAGDGPAWASARGERAAWRAPRLRWGRSDWDKQSCWARPYLMPNGPSVPVPAQQQAARSPWRWWEGGVFTSRRFSPLCGCPGASPEN